MEERILIVDDDITFALMLRTWLSQEILGALVGGGGAHGP